MALRQRCDNSVKEISHRRDWRCSCIEKAVLLLQTLVANELRDRVTLRVDGGMRSGRDVLVSAALGGDEFGFGTVAMIATGCIMARVCHTNNCPVGVASQREELRARFPGAPGDLVSSLMYRMHCLGAVTTLRSSE